MIHKIQELSGRTLRLENLAHRAERKLGIKRQAKAAAPTLADYIAARDAEKSARQAAAPAEEDVD